MTTDRMLPTRGYVNPDRLPRGPNGRALCRWCGQEVAPPRKTFCGGTRTSLEWRISTADQYRDTHVYRTLVGATMGQGCIHEHLLRSSPAYARLSCWVRDRGQCALCPTACGDLSGPWDCDHVKPVVKGGGSCGLENLRTLCRPCHKRETKLLAARRAEARRANAG